MLSLLVVHVNVLIPPPQPLVFNGLQTKATLRLKSDKGGETITNCTKGTTTLPCTTWTASAWAQGQALAVDTEPDQ